MRVDGDMVHPMVDATRCIDREFSDLLVRSLLRRMRQALLQGHAVTAPGIGELSVRQARRYALVNPANGQALSLGGERTILFRAERDLIQALNTPFDAGADDAL